MASESKYRIKGTNFGYDLPIIALIILLFSLYVLIIENKESVSELRKSNTEKTKPVNPIIINKSKYADTKPENKMTDCLINIDWVYVASEKLISAFKFSKDGTFNFSSILFGGTTVWGSWTVVSSNEVLLNYTKTTQNNIPTNQIITISNCNYIIVGNTIYSKY